MVSPSIGIYAKEGSVAAIRAAAIGADIVIIVRPAAAGLVAEARAGLTAVEVITRAEFGPRQQFATIIVAAVSRASSDVVIFTVAAEAVGSLDRPPPNGRVEDAEQLAGQSVHAPETLPAAARLATIRGVVIDEFVGAEEPNAVLAVGARVQDEPVPELVDLRRRRAALHHHGAQHEELLRGEEEGLGPLGRHVVALGVHGDEPAVLVAEGSGHVLDRTGSGNVRALKGGGWCVHGLLQCERIPARLTANAIDCLPYRVFFKTKYTIPCEDCQFFYAQTLR